MADDVQDVATTPRDTPQAGGRTCMHCGSPLRPGARFCTECELFQRHFWKSKSSLGYWTLLNAAMVTMILVGNLVILALPQSDAFANSDVNITTPTCYLDRALVGVSNRGNRFATFLRGRVIATGLEDPVGNERPLLIWPTESQLREKSVGILELIYLSPGGSNNSYFTAPEQDQPSQCKYTIELAYEDFRPPIGRASRERTARATCPCAKYSYSTALRGVQRRLNMPATPQTGAPAPRAGEGP